MTYMDQLKEKQAQLAQLMDKYKKASKVLLGTILVYVLVVFFVKQNWVTVIMMVVMFAVCIWSVRVSKQVKTAAEEVQKLKAELAPDTEEIITEAPADLNHLPRNFTVADDVELEGVTIPHIIVSPYSIIILGEQEHKKLVDDVLTQLDLQAPVTVLPAGVSMDELNAMINASTEIVLTEDQIFKILYRLNDIE